jgi:pantetheine-phosphate adenylyltransferase
MTAPRAEVALFPGTFDPFTYGHLDLAARAARLFPRVVAAVAQSSPKTPLFSVEERMEMIAEAVATLAPELRERIEVRTFAGLVAGCAREIGAHVMIRGLRAVSDFEFEFQMALMNRKLSPELEIVYLMPDVRYTYLSSGVIKEVARLGGDVSALVPERVCRRLLAKFATGGGA